jgi:hypothetical protein
MVFLLDRDDGDKDKETNLPSPEEDEFYLDNLEVTNDFVDDSEKDNKGGEN